MGWESRDWAKWTDEERRRHLGATAPAAPSGSGDRTRTLVWSALGAVVAALVMAACFANLTIGNPHGGRSAEPAGIGHTIYGWRQVPPYGFPGMDPAQVSDRIGDDDVICTVRQPAGGGRWVCTSYGIIHPGWRVVVLPVDYPDTYAPCSQSLAPGGRVVPCPKGPPPA